MDLKKVGCKKQGHCYSKREETRLPLLFLNNNDPVFCNLLFSGPYLDLIFFQGHKPTHVFKTRIVGANWLGVTMYTDKIQWFLFSLLIFGQISNKFWLHKEKINNPTDTINYANSSCSGTIVNCLNCPKEMSQFSYAICDVFFLFLVQNFLQMG